LRPNPNDQWAKHHVQWRDPAQIASWWEDADRTDPGLLRQRARGKFWEVLESTGQTLIVSREYEHLLMGLTALNGRPYTTYMRIPHPSGVAWDASRDRIHVASTRNPNQILDLSPIEGYAGQAGDLESNLLIPARSRFYRGALYLHDLAMVGDNLHGNAVSMNSVVEFDDKGGFEPVWWPKSMEQGGQTANAGLNYLQLNSIAAGPTLKQSFFSASAEAPSSRRPGHLNFPVDKRGVIFGGEHGEPVVRGLTRPHSARLHQGRLWVDNSGYGQLGVQNGKKMDVVAKLPGWTRGLAFHSNIAFVGTSRIIPRFARYAPGVNANRAACGLHAVDIKTGEVLGSLIWPEGNQIFAIECVPFGKAIGLPFQAGRKAGSRERRMFYSFIIKPD